jgi:hypothetical protein
MRRVVLFLSFMALVSLSVRAQDAAKPTQETRPADPRPAVAEINLNLNVNPDTQFYKLATGVRMENEATNNWRINTLGFRDVRVVVYMGADSKKENRASGSSIAVTMHVKEGDQEVELAETEVPISAGKTTGKAFVWPVFSNAMTIRVTTKNIAGSVYVTAYAVK